jgi:hypothetical protein
MDDEEKFSRLREIESVLIPSIHRLGIFYLGEIHTKIQTLDIEVFEADPAALGYKRALADVTTLIEELIDGLMK